MSKRFTNILLSCGALVLGGILYILLRPSTYIGKLFDDIVFIEMFRNTLSVYPCTFLKYYLPDFLWVFSLSCGLIAIFDSDIKGTVFCTAVAFLCGVFWETMQFFCITTGVGDFADIFMYLLAAVFAVIINIKRGNRNEKSN